MGKTKNVMLTITEKCNLNCVYCFENNKSDAVMSFDTAKSIIDKEMHSDDGYDNVLFDFMGGEPFLAFETIKKICEYVWENTWPKGYSFFASTNGTLVHNNIKDWLEENKDRFVCGVSLDGVPEIQNKNRSGSDSLIEKDFFVRTWPNQEAKMTIYPANLSNLAENVIYLHELGFKVTSNLAYGPDWGASGIKDILTEQLQKLIEYYDCHNDTKPTTLVNMEIRSVAYAKEELIKWCGMGNQMVAYDINGVMFPCHFFQEMNIGSYQYSVDEGKDFSHIQDELDKECKACILRNCCPTCYAYNYVSTGKYGFKDKNMCQLKKIMAAATSKLEFNRVNREYEDVSEVKDLRDKEVIRAIYTIQNAIKTGDWSLNI